MSSSMILGAAIPAAAIMTASGAQAQQVAAKSATANADVAEVVVTARHTNESVQNVPLSVGVVSGVVAQQQHISTLRGVAQMVPNFDPTIVTPRVAGLAIRGIGAQILNGNGDGAQSGVGYIVDNVFLTYVGFSWPDLVDFDSIQIARGPQGTLLGKNTTIGAVIINTALPSFNPSFSSETSYGNYNRTEERVNMTGPLLDGKVAGRLTFFGDWGDGFYKNIGPGSGNHAFLDQNRWGVRGQLYFIPTDSTLTDRVIVHYDKSDELDTYPAEIGPGFSTYANGTPHKTYGARFLSIFGYSPSYNPYVANVPIVPNDGVHTYDWGISNELNKTFGDLKLTSISSYDFDHVYPHNGIGFDGQQLLPSNTYDVNVSQLSQETRLADHVSDKIDVQVGNYLLYEHLTSSSINIYGNEAAVWLSGNPSQNNDSLTGLHYEYDGLAVTESAALFGQATWHATRQLDLTFGIRDTFEHVHGGDTGYYYGGVPNSSLNAADLAFRLKQLQSNAFTASGGGFHLSETKDNNSVSYLFNPAFKITPDIMLYGSYAHGEKSGAVDTTALPIYSSNGVTQLGHYPVITLPEQSDDIEVGLKTAWMNRRITANVNIYQDTVHNYQAPITDLSYTDPATGQPLSKTYLGNVPEIRLRGVELEMTFAVAHGVAVYVNGAYTDDRYVNFPNAAAPADLQYAGGPKAISLNGDALLNVAPYTGHIGATYDRYMMMFGAREMNLFGYANAFLSAKVPFSLPQSTYHLYQSAYSLINAGIGVRTEDGKYSFELWGKNLGDTHYLYGQETLGSTTNEATAYLGNPRTYGLTFKFKL